MPNDERIPNNMGLAILTEGNEGNEAKRFPSVVLGCSSLVAE
jgi:hypothetical protein